MCSTGHYRIDYKKDFVMQLTTPNGVVLYDDAGSVGTGLNGHAYKDRKSGKTVVILATDIVMDANPGHTKVVDIVILNDRAYWPCK